MPRACIDQEMRLALVLARMELQGFAVVREVCASEDHREWTQITPDGRHLALIAADDQ